MSHKSNFSRFPLLWLAVAFAAGIAMENVCFFKPSVLIFTTLFSAIFGVALSSKSADFAILCAFTACGFFSASLLIETENSNSLRSIITGGVIESGEPVKVDAVIESFPEISPASFDFVLGIRTLEYKAKKIKAEGNIRAYASYESAAERSKYMLLRKGDEVRVSLRVFREQKFLNSGSFDVVANLDKEGIDANGAIESPELLTLVDENHGFSVGNLIGEYRNNLILKVSQTFSPDVAGIVIASVVGNENFLTKQTGEVFREGGTFHVLVISGLHITFIGGILLFISRKLFRKPVFQVLFTVVPLWVYAIAVGGNAPVVRAALMFTLVLVSGVFYRNYNALNALGAAVLLILIFDPASELYPSLQLTIVSVAAIITLGFPLVEKCREIGTWMPRKSAPLPPNVPRTLRRFCESIYWNERDWNHSQMKSLWTCRIRKSEIADSLTRKHLQKPLRFLFEGIIVSAAVQICMLPLLAFYFHRIGFISILLNFWFGILMVFLNTFALAAVFLGSVSTLLRDSFVYLAELCTKIMLLAPNLVFSERILNYRVALFVFRPIYLLYFVPLIALIAIVYSLNPFSRDTRIRRIALSTMIVSTSLVLFSATLIVFYPYSRPNNHGKLRIDFIDVGQGDSALITFPHGGTLLVDAGGQRATNEPNITLDDGRVFEFEADRQSIGEAVVSPFLWENGIGELDDELATHADADHIEGMKAVTRNFSPNRLLIGIPEYNDIYFANLINAAVMMRTKIQEVRAGERFEQDGTRILVLNPPRDVNNITANDGSVTFLLTYGKTAFLFTGDIEKDAEEAIVAEFPNIHVNVVKVPHHGSKTSSTPEFIRATQPQIALIPVGKTSPYGHPDPQVVRRWKDFGAKIITTGEKGTVTIFSDGERLEVSQYKD
ncbi:MAG: ComEC/Rec2 family competence protein [Pyrinomonadaceae bacterium]